MAAVDQLQKIYIGYFGRAADPAGLNYWVGRNAAGMSLTEIATSFSVQDEATSTYTYLALPNLGNGIKDFLQSVYQNLFNRGLDAEGEKYWTGKLTAPGATVGSVILDIISGAKPADAAVLANKVTVANHFTTQFAASGATWGDADAANDIADARAVVKDVGATDASVNAGKSLADSKIAADLAENDGFRLTADAPTVIEGNAGTKELTFTLKLDRAPSEPLTVNYETLATGAASPNNDFTVAAGSVVFAAGQDTASVTLSVLGDNRDEADESIRILFSGEALAASVTAEGTIVDNDASPVFTSAAALSVAENTTAPTTVGATDADGDAVTLAIVPGADAARFQLKDGALSFIQAPNFEAPADGGADNVYNVTLRATDAHGNATDQALAVTVTNANEAPTAAPVTITGATEDAPANVTAALVQSGADVDAGTTLSVASVGNASKGTVTLVNGVAVFDPGAAFQSLAAGKTEQVTFDYTLTDGALTSGKATATLVVAGANDAPVPVADETAFVITGNSVTIDVLANDTDVDAGTTLAIAAGATANVGTVKVEGGKLVYTAPATFKGEATISYSVTDGTTSVAASQKVSVGDPVLTAAKSSVNEGEAIVFNIKGAPTTVYGVELTSVGLSADEAKSEVVTVTTDANGVASLSYTTIADRKTEGPQSLSAKIVGLQESKVDVADISKDNTAPAVTAPQLVNGTEDTSVTITVSAIDAEGDALTYAAGAAGKGTVTGGGDTGVFTYTPNPDANGPDSFVVTVTDALGAKKEQTVNVNIAAVNDAPELQVAASAKTVDENTTAVTTFTTLDVDGDAVTVTLEGADAARFQVVDGNLNFRPSAVPDFEIPRDANEDNVYHVTLVATDGNGGSTSRDVAVTVADVIEPREFDLTTSRDAGAAFTGTAGNDVYNAHPYNILGGYANTLQSWDSLDGAGGTGDTLNIFVGAEMGLNIFVGAEMGEDLGGPVETLYNGAQVGTVKNIELINIYNTQSIDTPFNGGEIDASKFEGAQQIWQIGAVASDVVEVGSTTTVGFDGTTNMDLRATQLGSAAVLAETVVVEFSGTTGSIALKGVETLDGSKAGRKNSDFTSLLVGVTGTSLETLTISGSVTNVSDPSDPEYTGYGMLGIGVDTTAAAGPGATLSKLQTVILNVSSNVDVGTYGDFDAAMTNNVTTFDASGSTGGVYLGLRSDATSDTEWSTIKTGSGADIVSLKPGANTSAQVLSVALGDSDDVLVLDDASVYTSKYVTLDGGDGNADTVIIQGTDAAEFGARKTVVTGFENLTIQTLVAATDASKLADFAITVEGAAVGGALVDIASGTTIGLRGSLLQDVTLAVANADKAGAITDSLVLNVTDVSDSAPGKTVTVAHVETISIVSNEQAKATGDANIITLTATATHTLNVSGSEAFTLNANPDGTVSGDIGALRILDASDLGGKLTADLSGVTSVGVAVTLGSGGSDLTLSNGKDIATLGAGADTIEIELKSDATQTSDSTPSAMDKLIDFDIASDAIRIDDLKSASGLDFAVAGDVPNALTTNGTITVLINDGVVTGFAKGNGTISATELIVGTDSEVDSLGEIVALLDLSTGMTAGKAVAFEFDGDSYLFVQNTIPTGSPPLSNVVDDVLVQLVGVTGLTSMLENTDVFSFT